jgi:hypothetical protein
MAEGSHPHHLHLSGTGMDAGTVELVIIEDQVVVLGAMEGPSSK